MKEKIEEIRNAAKNMVDEIVDLQELQELKVKLLGKKSELSNLLKGLGELAQEERPKVGAWVNEARKEIEEKSGRSVITSKNATELNQVIIDLIEDIVDKDN